MKGRQPVRGSGYPGIILAAGASRRMGRNKMLIPFEGEPLIRRMVRRAAGAGIDPLIVVVGHQAEQLRSALTGLACAFVSNPEYTGPTSGSLHAGLRAVAEGAPGALVMLGDMPLVTSEMLRQITTLAMTTSSPIVASRYGDALAPPLLFGRQFFDELLAWHGEGCGKQVLMAHLAQATILDWPATTLADIDTPADLAAVAARARSSR